ncbi:MAG: hypothetical protein KBF92_01225 [Bacteroidia bacterium]|nr:hypothetical protein [Bacteroidota bacterium]MBK7430118.1 hypothetical protein [Bacteroidota bacterium]MBP9791236.1 hypothetical protein [Bacteroidia bacterium]MBP9922423.1 hypothetical protein [Bacteroidia bacterium]
MKKVIQSSILLSLTLTLFAFDLPSGWFTAGSKPNSYEMGIEKGAGPEGNNAATIKSNSKKTNGFGTMMQECKPDQYLGKRIRMSCFIRTENVKGWVGLWLRVDQAGSSKPLSFDNMNDRKITGTTSWTKYEIVLDVPSNAFKLAYGVLLDETGQVWFDNVTFEIVSDKVKTTGSINGGTSPVQNEPTNLNFEK